MSIIVDTEQEALDILNSKSGKGELKIITSECESYECVIGPHNQTKYPITNPYHFVLHDVTSIENLENGLTMAHSDEGDWTVGNAVDLLKRLTEFEDYQ